MTDLTDRMRTCAAHLASVGIGATTQAIDDAAALLVEAAHEIDVLTGPIDMGEPMEVIPDEPTKPPDILSDELQQKIERIVVDAGGIWIAAGDTMPIANPYRSQNACPTCDSRAPKRVRCAGKSLVFVCPVCGLITKKPPAEGTAGGKE